MLAGTAVAPAGGMSGRISGPAEVRIGSGSAGSTGTAESTGTAAGPAGAPGATAPAGEADPADAADAADAADRGDPVEPGDAVASVVPAGSVAPAGEAGPAGVPASVDGTRGAGGDVAAAVARSAEMGSGTSGPCPFHGELVGFRPPYFPWSPHGSERDGARGRPRECRQAMLTY
ncbi:hypothetical protein GCM10022252_78620 [Streptosporangium oxazolinicum]|uniref:Uncharacterized protein n=1 Tax=Streptosporangium oxazolinicum TaxID=909287 RepID=A0ABP8BMN3_9ACTN